MKERDLQRLWGKYLQIHPPKVSEAHELKLSKTKSIRIDAVKPHQILGLQNAKTGLYYKIQDMAATNGFANPKPFDDFWLKDAEGYVLILFYVQRKPKIVYKIPIAVWIDKTKDWPKKSIREEEIKVWHTEMITI